MKNSKMYNGLVAIKRKEIMLEQRGTSLVQEGIFIEAGKVFLEDAIKNLMASGAVVLSGGLPADTVVEIMYAIERTKKAINMYNSIIEAKDNSKIHMINFMRAIDNAILENNIEELTHIGIRTAIDLSQELDSFAGKGTSGDIAHDTKVIIDDLREDFLEFFKVKLSALADWVSSFIPDDGGNISTFLKITMLAIIEDASKYPLQTFIDLASKLPGEGSKIIFDEAQLESFLIDLCNQVADGIEGMRGGYLDQGIDVLKDYTNQVSDYMPDWVADTNEKYGLTSQNLVNRFAGEDSNLGKASRAFFDPVYRMDTADELFDKTIDEFPSYIRNEIIPNIGNAVDIYAKFMKYIIAFLGLLEATTSGTLEKTFRLNQDTPNVSITSMLNNRSEIDMTSNDKIVAEVRRSLRKQLRQRRIR
jgi:hypothetical protein